MRDRSVTSARRRARRRAAGTLFFMIVALPVMWFAGAVAIDSLHVIGAQRRAGQLADAAALAGAAQFALPGEADWDGTGLTLNRERARVAAEELIEESVEVGAARGLSVREVSVQVSNSAPATVYVDVDYTVEDLNFYALAGGDSTFGVVDGRIERSASVCVPAVNAGGARYCARPRVGGVGEGGAVPPGSVGGVEIGTPVVPGVPPVDTIGLPGDD